MTTTTNRAAYYVAFGNRFSYVRGIDAAYARLADYLGTTAADVRSNRADLAGLILAVDEDEAAAAGLDQ